MQTTIFYFGDNERVFAGIVCETPEGSRRMMKSKHRRNEGFDVSIRTKCTDKIEKSYFEQGRRAEAMTMWTDAYLVSIIVWNREIFCSTMHFAVELAFFVKRVL